MVTKNTNMQNMKKDLKSKPQPSSLPCSDTFTSVWYYKYTFENTILPLNLFHSSALNPSEHPV